MVTAPSKTTTRSTLSHRLVTDEVLDKATQLFADKGYEATSLADIANELGISRPALYHYVNNKEELLVQLVEQVSQQLAEVLEQLSSREDISPTKKLVDAISLMVRQRAQHPNQFRILDRSEYLLPEPAGTEHHTAKRKVLRQVASVIESGINTREFRHVDARTTALSILGMCNWVAWWVNIDTDIDAIVATVTDLASTMLVAGDAQPRTVSNQDTVAQIKLLLDRLSFT